MAQEQLNSHLKCESYIRVERKGLARSYPEYKSIGVNMKLKTNTGISLTKPKPITSENIKDKIVSDDELKQRIINGELVDEKLEATLFPNGKPNK